MKGGKRNIRSGNTFRKVGGRCQKNKQQCPIIIRHSSNLSRRQASDEADDSHISADAVQYSLNKKGRWNLPDVIQENIAGNEFDDDVDGVRVSMLKRHMVNRQSDCLRVITNTPEKNNQSDVFQRKKARRKIYCNGLNVLNNGRGKQTNDRRKKQVISTKVEIAARKAASEVPEPTQANKKGDNLTPEVRYDVFYPLPAFSSLRYHPKFARPVVRADDIEQSLTATPGLKSGKGSKKRNKHVNMDDAYLDDEYLFEDDFDMDYEEENYCETAATYAGYPRFTESDDDYDSLKANNLADIVAEALYAASWRSPDYSDDAELVRFSCSAGEKTTRRRKRASRRKGRRYMYETERRLSDAGSDFSTDNASSSDANSDLDTSAVTVAELSRSLPASRVLDDLSSRRVNHVSVVLPEAAVTRTTLAQKYGANLMEAACFPRKFLIDITERVRDSLKSVEAFRDAHLPSKDLLTCLVFSHVLGDVEMAKEGKPSETDADGTVAGNEAMESRSNSKQGEAHVVVSNEDGLSWASVSSSVYNVALNMNYQGNISIDTLRTMTKYSSVDEVLNLVLEYICTLKPDKLVYADLECPPCDLKDRGRPDFDTVGAANGWQATFFPLSQLTASLCLPAPSRLAVQQSPLSGEPREASLLPSVLDSAAGVQHSAQESTTWSLVFGVASSEAIPETKVHVVYSTTSNGSDHHDTSEADNECIVCVSTPSLSRSYCGICFDDLHTSEGTSTPATALRSCRHWFCDTCWLSHLLISVRGGVSGSWGRGVLCPEYRCRAQVDAGTLMTLLHLRDVRLLTQRRLHVEVTRSGRSKWCPNPLCGRLIQISTDSKRPEPTSLACTCGTRLCFTCLGSAHWPASCHVTKQYHALLMKNGDFAAQAPESSTDVRVLGKACPSCGVFMEKNGGCNNMICMCGIGFCWWCLKIQCVCRNRHSDKENVVTKVVRHVDTAVKEGDHWYRLAVHHRQMQHIKLIKTRSKMADSLAGKLQASARKRSVLPVSATHASADNLATLKKTTRAILKLKTELHHVMEHTAAVAELCLQNRVKDTVKDAYEAAAEARPKKKARSPMTLSKVNDVLGYLGCLCSSLDLLLQTESAPELALVIPRFRQMREGAKNSLKVLATLTSLRLTPCVAFGSVPVPQKLC